jgi:hypothetical protein
VQAADLDRQGLGFEPVAVTGRQGWFDMERDSSSRTQALSVSFQRRSILPMTPSKGFEVL